MRLVALLGLALWLAGCAVRQEGPNGITIEHDAYQPELATAEAVRQASRTVLAERRAKRLSTHPFYWAGFVAAGDWR